MKNKVPHDHWFRNIALILVGGALLLALIDPSVRPLFFDVAKAGLTLYIGRSLPELKG